jgi:diguanylate cyclase (GGDEF)-like protein
MHALADGAMGPRDWVSALLAMAGAAVLGVLLIAAAIALAEGQVDARAIADVVAMDVVVTVSNAGLGLCGALVAALDVRALPLLAGPTVVVLAAYRAHVSERERHKQMDFLLEANRALASSPEVAQALEGLLSRSLEAFRAELAEIVLFGSDEAPSLRTVLGPGPTAESLQPIEPAVADALAGLIETHGVAVMTLDPPFDDEHLHHYLEARGVTHALMAPMTSEDRVIGTIMVANRFGVMRTFDGEDRRLLETLAANASVALQYDRLEQAVTRLATLQEQLQHQAHHDPLTGLANRKLFTERLRAATGAVDEQVAVLFIDLDEFKAINDRLGHAAGDELLMSVAGRLRRCVRPDDLVARLGGDEFAVIVRDATDVKTVAVGIAQRVMETFAAPVALGAELVEAKLSLGVACGAPGTASAEALVADADVAMYEAKSAGKNCFRIYEPSMSAILVARDDLREELRLALERQELRLYFQPIVALADRSTVGTEALVRWQHPQRGLVTPAEFIPLAEETGLILSLSDYVIEQACLQARTWSSRPEEKEPFTVHVNLSAVELRDPDFPPRVEALLARTGAQARSLVFEINESVLAADNPVVRTALARLDALGVGFALDDFGNGVSSLNHLHTLPLNTLKVAKSFVDGLDRPGKEAVFVRTILALARTLGLRVIAEGVETEEQVQALRALGCGLGQGFHLGRPRPAASRAGMGLVA